MPTPKATKKTTKTTKPLTTGQIIAVTAGVGMAVLYWFVIRPFAHMGSEALSSEITQRLQRLKQLQLPGRLAPTPETLAALQEQHKRLAASFDTLAKRIDPEGLPAVDPSQEPGLYFGERLHTVQKELERRASASQTALPQTLGLSEELPQAGEVPWLLRELALVELVVTTLMDQQAQAIELVKVVPRRTIQGPAKPLLTELGVEVRAKGSLATFLRALAALRDASPVAAVPELRLQTTDDPAVLEGELLVTSYVIRRES